jgi:hypothetical protein
MPADLNKLRALAESATPGPWVFNSYSGVYSAPRSRERHEAEDMIPLDAPDDAYDALPEALIASVPVQMGDTATTQGARDAALIAAARTAIPELCDEVEAGAQWRGNWEACCRELDKARAAADDERARAEQCLKLYDEGKVALDSARARLAVLEGLLTLAHLAWMGDGVDGGKALADVMQQARAALEAK